MKILLTNDDGYQAVGINILAKYLREAGHKVYIVAPKHEQSAGSHAITVNKPVFTERIKENIWSVDAKPVDCVFIALEKLIDEDIDLVLSGINSGQNMGEDLLYSGTVAAAAEAMLYGKKAVALSIENYENQKFETAAYFTVKLIEDGIVDLIGEKEMLNINFPDVEIDQIKGVKITKTGHREYSNFVHEQYTPSGKKVFWVGGNSPETCNSENSDYLAVSERFISITPVYPDFTKKESIKKFKKFIEIKGRQ